MHPIRVNKIKNFEFISNWNQSLDICMDDKTVDVPKDSILCFTSHNFLSIEFGVTHYGDTEFQSKY